MTCTNGCLYLAGDIANDRKPAHPKTPLFFYVYGCFVGGFEVADVLEPPLFLDVLEPGNDTNIDPLFWIDGAVEYSPVSSIEYSPVSSIEYSPKHRLKIPQNNGTGIKRNKETGQSRRAAIITH